MKQTVLRMVLRILRWVDFGDIRIRHHYTGQRFVLHPFRHRGFWVSGKDRERNTMLLFAELISPGDIVFEIGGHIGYVAMYLSAIVGEKGRVVVFEPGENNLPYLRRNVAELSNVTLEECAVSDVNGEVSFVLENHSGQNNSMIRDYHNLQNTIRSARNAGSRVPVREVRVRSTRLDSYKGKVLEQPDFLKIDVEGAEFLVLSGMRNLLESTRPLRMMVEVTHRSQDVFDLLSQFGFVLFDEEGELVSASHQPKHNWFCVRQSDREGLAILAAKKATTAAAAP